MTTHPERPNPPTDDLPSLETANARYHHDTDTWEGLTLTEEVLRGEVTAVIELVDVPPQVRPPTKIRSSTRRSRA